MSLDSVLVTGAGGFIGSHLVERLVKEGAKVRALVHYNSRNDWGNLEHLDPQVRDAVEVVTGDVRDPHLVNRLARGVQVAFHLAALIAIPHSYVSPGAYVDTNMTGTLNMLQACRDHGVSRFIHTSTSEVYGSAQYVPIDERHPLNAQSPYAATKIGADQLVNSFYASFELPTVIVRPFNTYGPRQSMRAIIPAIAAQALSGPIVRLGAVTPIRDLNYVSDTVEGFLCAASSDAAVGRTLNLGTGSGVSIQTLADMIIEMTGNEATVQTDAQRYRPEASEVDRLIAAAGEAERQMNWRPKVSLEEGLALTIDWLKSNIARYKVAIYNT